MPRTAESACPTGGRVAVGARIGWVVPQGVRPHAMRPADHEEGPRCRKKDEKRRAPAAPTEVGSWRKDRGAAGGGSLAAKASDSQGKDAT